MAGRNVWRGLLLSAGALAVAAGVAASASAATLDTVKARGRLVCGVSEGLVGLSIEDNGTWTGFDVDFCRALAAAIFGDPGKVEYVPLSVSERFIRLTGGKIDVLSRNSTWTMSREVELALTFVGVAYYDGQGFLVPRARNISSALELAGTKVCVQGGTTSEANLTDYFSANNMPFEAIVTMNPAESLFKYRGDDCGAISADVSQLYAERLKLADPAEHIILADVISKEPLGPVVRQDDPKWATLVKWVLFALLDAEELGVGSDNIEEALASKKPEVRRLVGLEGDFGERLGLSKDWAVNVVRLVGNYGEIYDRNLGTDSKLGIPRGLNQLWHLGGIQYAPPIR